MPVCQCCPNFISPGVERCETCATPVGPITQCPECLRDILEDSEQCRHCGTYLHHDEDSSDDYTFTDDDPSDGEGFDDEFDQDDF